MIVIKKILLILRKHGSVIITLMVLNVTILTIAFIGRLILQEEVYKKNLHLGVSKCADAVNHLDRIVYTGEFIVNFVEQDIRYFQDASNSEQMYKKLLFDTYQMINKKANYFINLYLANNETIINTINNENVELSSIGRPWYEEALKKDGMYISNPYVDMVTGNNAITISRRVLNSSDVIGLDIAQEKISSIIERDVKENENIVSGLVINRDAVIMGQAGEEYFGLVSNNENNQTYLKTYINDIINNEYGQVFFEEHGDKYILVHQKTASDWHVVYLVNKEWLSQDTSFFRNGLIFMFILCLTLLNIIVLMYYHKRLKAINLKERAETAEKEVSLYNERLEMQVLKKTAELKQQEYKLKKLNESILDNLADIVEFRDIESGLHIKRIKEYTYCLALKIQELYPEYNLSNDEIEKIYQASALHDLGKVGIADSILLKPGKLTVEEFETMKTHTIIGDEIVTRILANYDPDLLRYGHEICRYHHERYNGKGYPIGLKGEEIPISAQIVGVADVYDALITKRVYKDAFPHEVAVNMIKNGECGIFSEKLLRCLDLVEKEFENTSKINQ